jgi:hypothetical protein
MKKKKHEYFPLNWFIVYTGYDSIAEGISKSPRCAFRYEDEAALHVAQNFKEFGLYEQNTVEE